MVIGNVGVFKLIIYIRALGSFSPQKDRPVGGAVTGEHEEVLFNAGTCQQCQNPIPANEMVMKVNSNLVFHTKCFTCNKCGIQLMTGDKYCLLSGYPICEADWHKAVKSSNVSAVTAGVTGNGSNTQRKAKVQPMAPLAASPAAQSPSSTSVQGAAVQASPSGLVHQPSQVDVVDVGVGGEPYSPPPPGHQHYHHHHHHHQPHQPPPMGMGLLGLAHHHQPPLHHHLQHQQPSYQEWVHWGEPCD
ncbi:hypothetical protein KQX54_007122 [Cotesia glomerata]|uniref:LIM zinc-binding domain-containing protein n=1 Tax=Cotesia glomerata TaxID=32391 RepID=A0AAV7J2Z7_COTGL|nr:hypothetical protein KQX54_007122 [Cotesia glomerata]